MYTGKVFAFFLQDPAAGDRQKEKKTSPWPERQEVGMQKSSLLRGRIHRILVSFIIIVVGGVGEAAFSQNSEASGVDQLYAEAKAATDSACN